MSEMLGVLLASATAVLWAFSPLCFASAGRRVGGIPVSLVRILVAAAVLLAVLPLYYLLTPARFVMPTGVQLAWLVASGVTGIVLGDSLVYESLVKLGPRRTTQLYALQPVVSVIAGYLMGEALGTGMLLGIGVVVLATAAAIFARPEEEGSAEPGRLTWVGLAFGISGSVFRGLGAVTGREVFRAAGPPVDPMLATTLRVVTATAVAWALPIARGQTRELVGILWEPGVAKRLLWGTALGPILGMLCYVSALKQVPAGLVSAIMATSPLLVLPYVTVKYRAKLGVVTPVAAAAACAGVAVMANPVWATAWLERVLRLATAM